MGRRGAHATVPRARLPARLVDKHAISQELAKKLLTWRHPGSRRTRESRSHPKARALSRTAGYVVRNPSSLRRLVYIDGQQARHLSCPEAQSRLGQNFVAMDPLEWLARMSDHIPDPGKHRTLFGSCPESVTGRK